MDRQPDLTQNPATLPPYAATAVRKMHSLLVQKLAFDAAGETSGCTLPTATGLHHQALKDLRIDCAMRMLLYTASCVGCQPWRIGWPLRGATMLVHKHRMRCVSMSACTICRGNRLDIHMRAFASAGVDVWLRCLHGPRWCRKHCIQLRLNWLPSLCTILEQDSCPSIKR